MNDITYTKEPGRWTDTTAVYYGVTPEPQPAPFQDPWFVPTITAADFKLYPCGDTKTAKLRAEIERIRGAAEAMTAIGKKEAGTALGYFARKLLEILDE